MAALAAVLVEFFLLDSYYLLTSPQSEIEVGFTVYALPLILATAFVEEIMKTAVIYKHIRKYFKKERLVAGALTAGLGFGLFESLLIVGQLGPAWKSSTFYVVEAGLLHMLSAGIIGLVIATAPLKKVSSLVAAAWGAGFAVHAFFNFLALKRDSYPCCLIYAYLFLLAVILAVYFIRQNSTLAKTCSRVYNKMTRNLRFS